MMYCGAKSDTKSNRSPREFPKSQPIRQLLELPIYSFYLFLFIHLSASEA
jgi:hypothetical protein